MKSTITAFALLLGAPVVGAQPLEIPETPAPASKLLYVRSFDVGESFNFPASREKPEVVEGTIVVLEVDPALVYPRQVAEPMLYIGAHPARKMNQGYPEGIVIAFVPRKVDLRQEPVWFGTPELPERVDLDTARNELELAESRGIAPFRASEVESAEAAGGLPLRLSDVTEFDDATRALFEEWVVSRREP